MREEEYGEGGRPPGRGEIKGSKCFYGEIGAKYMA